MKKIIFQSIIILLIFNSCKRNPENNYFKRLNAAKWLYYESNFKSKKVGCFDDKIIDSNICFIEGLLIDTLYIGDTLEFIFYSTLDYKTKCIPYNDGSFINLFGFYPDVDTVVYRANSDTRLDRKPEIEDSLSNNWEWAGIYSRSKQKIMFKEFIIFNQNKINSFLRKEAIKKGYFVK